MANTNRTALDIAVEKEQLLASNLTVTYRLPTIQLLLMWTQEFCAWHCIATFLQHINELRAHLPYIFPSSDRIILRRPQGGYIASASWKLCSMSGLHTPSASPSMALSSSSPPSSSPCSGLPLALHLLDAMVPAPTGPFHEPPRYTSTATEKQGKGGGGKETVTLLWA